jgi:hypothetical protein
MCRKLESIRRPGRAARLRIVCVQTSSTTTMERVALFRTGVFSSIFRRANWSQSVLICAQRRYYGSDDSASDDGCGDFSVPRHPLRLSMPGACRWRPGDNDGIRAACEPEGVQIDRRGWNSCRCCLLTWQPAFTPATTYGRKLLPVTVTCTAADGMCPLRFQQPSYAPASGSMLSARWCAMLPDIPPSRLGGAAVDPTAAVGPSVRGAARVLNLVEVRMPVDSPSDGRGIINQASGASVCMHGMDAGRLQLCNTVK